MARQAEMTPAELGSLIEAAGHTREEAAGSLGVSRRQLQRWLAGESPISVSRTRAIRWCYSQRAERSRAAAARKRSRSRS